MSVADVGEYKNGSVIAIWTPHLKRVHVRRPTQPAAPNTVMAFLCVSSRSNPSVAVSPNAIHLQTASLPGGDGWLRETDRQSDGRTAEQQSSTVALRCLVARHRVSGRYVHSIQAVVGR